jgi:hypothetical protein
MSWSIYLSGPKDVILKELGDASAIIQQAAESVHQYEAGPDDTVTASVSGYVSWDDKGVTSSSATQSVSMSRYVPPAPSVTVEKEAADPEAGNYQESTSASDGTVQA